MQNSRALKWRFWIDRVRRPGEPALLPSLEVDVDVGSIQIDEQHELFTVARRCPSRVGAAFGNPRSQGAENLGIECGSVAFHDSAQVYEGDKSLILRHGVRSLVPGATRRNDRIFRQVELLTCLRCQRLLEDPKA